MFNKSRWPKKSPLAVIQSDQNCEYLHSDGFQLQPPLVFGSTGYLENPNENKVISDANKCYLSIKLCKLSSTDYQSSVGCGRRATNIFSVLVAFLVAKHGRCRRSI